MNNKPPEHPPRKLRHNPLLGSWQRYESLKQAWIAKHPNASPAAYQQAMNELCKKCGV